MGLTLFLLTLIYSASSATDFHQTQAGNESWKFDRHNKESNVGAVTFAFAKHFQSHMVLQKEPQRANIYGFSPTIGQKVTLALNTVPPTRPYNYETTVRQGPAPGVGVWNFVLDPFNAGVAVVIGVTAGTVTISLGDVVFGDVWICSGQSNMQMTVSQIDGGAEEIADAHNYPNIRMMTVGMNESRTPLYDIIKAEEPWMRANNNSVGHGEWSYFSAVCWLFGKAIYKARQYPIGLVATDWGGTPVKAWSSPQALAHCGVRSDDRADQPKSFNKYVRDINYKSRLQGPGNSSVLWNAMINPLLGMTIYGAIWYQGETDSESLSRDVYNCTFPTMIKDWRSNWNKASNGQTSATFPFGFVQLAPNSPSPGPTTGFTDIRWHQTADRGYVPNPDMVNVFMAVAIDLPDFNSTYGSIHPRYKRDIGERLALSGLAVAYHEGNHFQGPLPTGSYTTDDGLVVDYGNAWTIRVVVKDGFEVQCAHQRWVAVPIVAHTTTTVTLNSQVCHLGERITGLRYAWSESPCALHSCAVYEILHDLPAPPFVSYADFDPNGEPYFTFDHQTRLRG